MPANNVWQALQIAKKALYNNSRAALQGFAFEMLEPI
jgi:hypothetical protein